MKVGFEPKKEATVEKGIKIPYPAERRKPPIWRWYAILLIFLSPVVYFAWTISKPMLLMEAPGFVRIGIYRVDAPRSGRVVALHVREGDEVAKGEKMLLLKDPDVDPTIEGLKKRLTILSEREKKVRQALDNDTKLLTLRMAKISRRIESLKKEVKSLAFLVEEGAATEPELDRVKSVLMRWQERFDDLRHRKIALKSDPELDKLRTEKIRLLSQLRIWRSRSKSLEIVAPTEGVVASLDVGEGFDVQKGAHLLDVLDQDRYFIQGYFSPSYFDDLVPGKRVVVRFEDGFMLNAVVERPPEVSARFPKDFAVLKEIKRAVVVRLKPEKPIPQRYRVANMPVKIYLNDRLAAWLIR